MAFSQRRIRLVEGRPAGIGGFDFFQLDTFGLPLLEVAIVVVLFNILWDSIFLMTCPVVFIEGASVANIVQRSL